MDPEPKKKKAIKVHSNGSATARVVTDKIVRTEADAIAVAQVDLDRWFVKKWECTQWTVPLRIRGGKGKKDKAVQTQQYRVSLYLSPRLAPELALKDLLKEIGKKGSITLPIYKAKNVKVSKCRRALELSIMDPHLGMHCFKPQSDQTWSLAECKDMFMSTVSHLLNLARPYLPFEEAVMALGNDYLHTDNLEHTTSGGTPMGEMVGMQEAYSEGIKLLLWKVEQLRALGVKKLRIKLVPGNHDRFSSFSLAHVIKAYYTGAKVDSVEVDASPSPYKFWAFGVNLIGFEHGHSVKPIRLAALMANETRLNYWKEARYCEWHLGDQHRKGSSKPMMHEEQGVSVEYLPGLTPPNEWHRRHSFNWQKRGAMAFVYDYSHGPIARFQVNFDNYTGKHLGVS